ncbi:MAG: 30S ribosomal protein S12 methylthiotransferase RimO [Lachnospiraceae bacterium]|nr:30S ribosomal protein S12 methylthiotransferase RimO [Lachnospiraceae bacterium]
MKPSSEKTKDPDLFRVFFISLGCDKNLVDSEQMIALLLERGYVMTFDEDEADLIVINSCCFIGDAKEESINTIIEMGEKKKDGRLKGLIVCGCLAQRYAEDIRESMPEVDAIVGTTSIDMIADAADKVMQRKNRPFSRPGSDDSILDEHVQNDPVRDNIIQGKSAGNDQSNHNTADSEHIYDDQTDDDQTDDDQAGFYINSIDRYVYMKGRREITGNVCSASLKIADGCNKNCSYCIIPKVRGHYRSVPMEDLLADAGQLAQKGVKELILIAQETTVYGTDLYGRKALPELLHKLCAIEGIEWIRLMYCYPEEITDELIECIRTESKICHYLDLPIQHCSDRILKLMGRKTDKDGLVNIIQKIREAIPDIALRTTLISGFPTETEQEHAELKEFVKKIGFDRLGCFTYSKEEGTAAALMDGQIHHSTKKRRQREIMELQQQIAFEKEAGQKDRKVRVIVEGRITEQDNDDHGIGTGEDVYVCRSYRDAPDIDGYVFVRTGRKHIMSGDIIEALITGSHGYDLTAETV